MKTECGFGCQLHHRAACLMISYAMGLPMIHDIRSDGEGGWSYANSWNDILQPWNPLCSWKLYLQVELET
jgi:hypothetical protein